jgi:UDP-galactopyranose mutase
MDVDRLVVGAGLSGATLAGRIATQRSESVPVVEQRDHIAGDASDVLGHRHGSPDFHADGRDAADRLEPDVPFLGRPADHRHDDMDRAVAAALKLLRTEIAPC